MTTIDQILKEALQLQHARLFTEAERAYNRVLSMHPGHAEASHMLGVLALNTGHHLIAADLIGQALASNPLDATAHCNMSIAQRALGKFEQSLASCNEAIRLKPTLAEAHINLGLTLMEMGRFREAADIYRHAIQMQPVNARIYTCLGIALSEQGDLAQSISTHLRAVDIGRGLAGAHLSLGMAMLLAGDFRGWKEYEWRLSDQYVPIRPQKLAQPQWHGEALDGKTILLHAEAPETANALSIPPISASWPTSPT